MIMVVFQAEVLMFFILTNFTTFVRGYSAPGKPCDHMTLGQGPGAAPLLQDLGVTLNT